MQIKTFIITLFIALIATNQLYSQIDEESETLLLAEDDDTKGELFNLAFKPIFGIGQGIFSFWGDVKNNYNTPLTGQWGTAVSISRVFGKSFELDLYAIFGKASGEKRSLEDTTWEANKNFQTSLFMGGVSVSYNFVGLFKRKRPILPFVALGVGFVQFQPRGDKGFIDADGNFQFYRYNNDGTLRDKNNNIVKRDYNFETELRDEKDYSLVTLSVPLDIGFNMTITDRLTLRIGNSFKLTFSEYIDDTPAESNRIYKNDILNYAYASLRLDLFSAAHEIAAVDQFKNVKYTITDGEDSDGDGVDDFNDECPDTPRGIIVDYRGCPLDADKDGVPDYMDDQPNSPPGSIVGPNGVRLTIYHLVSLLFDPKAVNRKDLSTYYSKERQQPRKKYDKMPEKFRQVDTNNDGWISPTEMRQAIDKVFDFNSTLTIEDVNELLEYFWVQ
jgi:hypothetical protein